MSCMTHICQDCGETVFDNELHGLALCPKCGNGHWHTTSDDADLDSEDRAIEDEI